jgi:hypothetical protein
MVGEPDYANYRKCMEEVKRRQLAVDEITSGGRSTSFKYTNAEFISLQYRKIFELVILASLASNNHLFEGLTRKLAKEWEIAKIIRLVKAKNPLFYPKPIDRKPSNQPGIKDDWVDVESGFLTLDDLTGAHGMIGNIMHATNPYRTESIVDTLEEHFPIWREKTIRLLNNHLVGLPNGNVLYVGMQSAETGSVHINLFSLRVR